MLVSGYRPVFDSTEGLDKAVSGLLDNLFEKESAILAEVLSSDGKGKDAKE